MDATHTQGLNKLARHGAIIGGPVREYVNGSSQDQLFMACVTQEDNGTQEGNARRLVACWNAFVGLDTENIETMVNVPEFFFKHMDILAQRDELLAALQAARKELHACQAVIHLAGGFDPAYVRDAKVALKVSDSAIAKATGGQG